MDKCENNICKCADSGQTNKCIEWCKKLNIRCVTRGTDPIPAKARTDKLNLKKGLGAENDKEIRAALNKLEKVKEI